jgi:hypothetical protein
VSWPPVIPDKSAARFTRGRKSDLAPHLNLLVDHRFLQEAGGGDGLGPAHLYAGLRGPGAGEGHGSGPRFLLIFAGALCKEKCE